MKPDWLTDARLIPDEVMSYIRKIAVHAVQEKGYSPEAVIDILGLSRSCIYDWLNLFKDHGYDRLDTKKAPGAKPVITMDMDAWLKQTILNLTLKTSDTTPISGPAIYERNYSRFMMGWMSLAKPSIVICKNWI